MHEIKDVFTQFEEDKLIHQLEQEINYWGETDYGRCQSIEIPLFMIEDLLNQPPFEVKEQLRKWYEYGQKTDQEREIDQEGQI